MLRRLWFLTPTLQDTKEVIAFQTLEVEGVPECRYLPLLPVSVGVEEHLAMGVATSTLAVADIIMREEMEEHDKAAGGGGEALFNSSLLVGGAGCRVQGGRCRVRGAGRRVGCRVQGAGCRV